MTKYVKKSKKLMTLVITAVFKLFKIWLQYFTSWFCSNSCFFFSLSRMMCALRAFQVARGIFGLSITMVGIFSTISFIWNSLNFKIRTLSNFQVFCLIKVSNAYLRAIYACDCLHISNTIYIRSQNIRIKSQKPSIR